MNPPTRISRHFKFLVNPRARNGHTLGRLKRLLDSSSAELSYEIVETENPAELRKEVSNCKDDHIPVAVGGDGTINLVVQTLLETNSLDKPIAIMPFGTGNAVARSIEIHTLKKAIQVLESGKAVHLDIMKTTHPEAPVALISISVGFESRFLFHYARQRRYTNAIAGIMALMRSSPFKSDQLEVRLDGRELVTGRDRYYNLGLYNLPCFAFGWKVPPAKDPADGFCEAIVSDSALSYWPPLLAAAGRYKHEDPPAERWRRWQRAEIDTTLPVQIDGESISSGRFEVEVLPQSLHILAPADFKGSHN